MNKPEAIIVAANGPSAQAPAVREWGRLSARVFRVNYFFLPQDDALFGRVDDWFICQHDPADFRACRAYMAGMLSHAPGAGMMMDFQTAPVFWVPGTQERCFTPEECSERLGGEVIRVQRLFAGLPAACRWERDLAPNRPLMGSFAIAVAVGMQPEKLYLCGHDLFKGAGQHGGVNHSTRGAWQSEFNRLYLANKHPNHTLRGDLAYIRGALEAYKGHVVCVGNTMKEHFAADFPQWDWFDE